MSNELTERAVVPGSGNIRMDEEGRYCWAYEFDMRKNPTILITVMKVLLLSFGIVMALMLIIQLLGSTFSSFKEYWDFFKWFLVLLAVFLVIGVISYCIVAKTYGWKYMVLFTMDEDSVEHRVMKSDFDKAKALGWLTALAGRATGNLGMMGGGILAATRSSTISMFPLVKKVKAVPRRNVIYVNQRLNHNQVYAEKEDFEFVLNFITEHCPDAKIIR